MPEGTFVNNVDLQDKWLWILIGLTLASACSWLSLLRRYRRPKPAAAPPALATLPRWGLVDLIAVLLVSMVAGATLMSTWAPEPLESGSRSLSDLPVPVQLRILLADASVRLLVSAGFLAVLLGVRGGSWREAGFRANEIGKDLSTGLIWSLRIIPVLYWIQLALVQWVKSEHPIALLVRQDHSPQVALITCFSAVIAAPIAEELFYRVIIQGWFERWALQPDQPETLLLGQKSADPTQTVEVRSVPRWPVLASASWFALMHYSHGPDWVPLLLFGLVLGALYRHTRSLLTVIVPHLILNAISMWQLFDSTS